MHYSSTPSLRRDASSNWLVLEGKETQMREVWVDNNLIKLSCLRHYVPLVVVRLGSREGCDSSLRAGLVGKKDKNKVIQIDTEHDPSRKIWRKRRLLILIQQPECCRHSSALFLFHVSTNILLLQETIRVLSFARKRQLRWSWNHLDRFKKVIKTALSFIRSSLLASGTICFQTIWWPFDPWFLHLTDLNRLHFKLRSFSSICKCVVQKILIQILGALRVFFVQVLMVLI